MTTTNKHDDDAVFIENNDNEYDFNDKGDDDNDDEVDDADDED